MYDLQIYKLINSVTSDGANNFRLNQEYVFKHTDLRQRILGVSVVESNDSTRIYILTSDRMMNVVEVREE
jgi:hypothetical protein